MTTASKQTSTTSMIIDGVAASEAIDSSGEILDVKGCDTSDFENGVGLLNYEHRGDQAQGASGNDIVGKIIYSKKIYKKVDCEGKRQEAYWDHVKLPFIYIKARLYDGAEHPGALALAAAIRDAVMHTEPILLRFSIEGTTLKKEGNRLLRTIGRKVALTFKPANKSAISGLISDPSGPKPISEKQGEKSLLSRLLEDDTSKSEAPGHQHLGSYEMAYNPIVEEDTVGLLKNAADAIRDLRLEVYEWHPVQYDFLNPMPLVKSDADFDGQYTPIEFALGTNKLRQLRDWLISHRMKKVNEHDERLPVPIKQALAHTGRDYDGNFSVERIQKLIDEKPKLKFNTGTTSYEYIQRHNQEPSKVFQLNLTNEQAKKLQDAGVWESFLNMHNVSKLSQHPVVPGTIGWVRYTGNKRGIHIDEVQSDYGRKWSALIEHQLSEAMAAGQLNPEQAATMKLDLTAKLPDEHLKTIQKTLFGNKHPAEVLHEAFHHWARSNGLNGAPVHIWTPQAKARMNGMDQNQPLPGHYNVTYKDVPEKMGMVEGKYGDIPTQNNPDFLKPKQIGTVGEDVEWKGSNSTFKDKIRKSEELFKALEGGMPSGAPSTLTQGAALQREDSRLHQHDFKNKLRAAVRDMGVEIVGKEDIKRFFKWQLPEINESFLDHFTDLVGDIKARHGTLDAIIAKLETPMTKAEEAAPEAPAPEAKPEKPKKPRATRPPKEKPPLPLPVEQYKPRPEAADPKDAPPQGKSKKGLVNGILYTPGIPQGIALHDWQNDATMLNVIHADDPGRSPNLTPEQRENIVKYVHTPWARAMKSWQVMNKLAEAGKLPPSIMAHAAIFAAMSPNTSVPIQELYFGHYMDFRRLHPDLFTNPEGVTPEDAIAFHNHLNSVEPPDFFNSYYTQGPGTMKYGAERLATRAGHGTQAGIKSGQAQLKDRPQGLPLLNYHKVHPTLMALHRQTKSDGRSFVDYIMQQKQTHGPGAFMYGFGPKLARYMGLMLGMGNMIVPDRHMMRSLFNLSLAQKPEFKSVAGALSEIEGERILRGVDKHFLENNPAVRKAHTLYPDHFNTRPEQAVGPGFWLHWLAYPHYEQMLGRPTENANSGTAHDPFWRAIPQILNEEGIPHDFQEPDEPWLKKAIADSTGIPERVARATKRVQDMFGEGAASLFFHAYGVPALIHNDKMTKLDGQHVRKAEYEALEEVSLIKREYAAIESARLCKTIDFNGVDEIYTVDGDTQHGRFWVKDGNLRILEDHEGVLRGRIHNGPVADNKDGIERMVMEGHRIKVEAPIEEGKEIELGQLAEDQIRPGGAPDVIEDPHMEDAPVDIEDMGASAHRPPPIFDFMLVGSNRPTVVEIHGQEIFENGSKLEQDDANWMLHQVHIGRATLRYHEGLAKTAPEVRQAMTGLHAAAKAGHIKPEHADAIRRGLFTDRLTGGNIGNQAAHEDFIEGQKGKPQGVHLHMDANDFGSINKMHGHPVGDQAIKTMANTMRETMDKHVGRKHGKLFRVGGDEFKAHFQTPAHASVFARALRQNLDQLVPVGGTHRISLSMGMGHSPEHAEQALMNAKTEKKAQNYPVGQAEHHVHSLLSGHEGSIPVASSSVPKLHLQPR